MLRPKGRYLRLQRWAWAASPAFGLLVVHQLLTGHPVGALTWGLQLLAALVLGSVMFIRPNRLGLLASAVVVLLSGLLLLERIGTAHVWSNDNSAFFDLVSPLATKTQVIVGDGQYLYRTWDLASTNSGVNDVEVTFEARAESKDFNGAWFIGDGQAGAEPISLRAASSGDSTPTFYPTDGGNYIYRRAHTGAPIAGRHFRATIETRSLLSAAAPTCGRILLAEPGARHKEEAELCPVAEWRSKEIMWTVPSSATRPEIDLLLIGFTGGQIQIKELQIEEMIEDRWTSVGVPAPTGAEIRLSWPDRDWRVGSSHRFIPEDTWKRYNVTLPTPSLMPGHALTGALSTETGTRVAIRNLELRPTRHSAQLLARPRSVRHRLWYPHPNILGHSLLALTTVAVVLGSPTHALLALPAGVAGITMTGSRAGLLALLPVLLFRLLSRRSPHQHRSVTLPFIIIGLLAIVGILQVSAFERSEQDIPRQEIWAESFTAVLEYPLLGLGAESEFRTYWQSRTGGDTEVSHAHNFWLQWSSVYGVAGAVAAIWWTAALVFLASRPYPKLGLALVTPFMLMNLFDTTLISSGVFVPLLAAINSLYYPSGHDRPGVP